MLMSPTNASLGPKRIVVAALLLVFAVSAYVNAQNEKLRIGLWAPVIERSFIAKAQARAAEHNVLAVGRPRAVSIVSGGVRQLLELGAIRPDGEDFVRVRATGIACEADAFT